MITIGPDSTKRGRGRPRSITDMRAYKAQKQKEYRARKKAVKQAHLGKLDIHFQSQFQETPSGVKVSSTLLRKLGYESFNSSDTDHLDVGEDR